MTQTIFQINYASFVTTGYGHKKVTVELNYNGNYNSFSATTNCMPLIDAASELEGQEKYDALYAIIENQIDEQVNNWIEDLN